MRNNELNPGNPRTDKSRKSTLDVMTGIRPRAWLVPLFVLVFGGIYVQLAVSPSYEAPIAPPLPVFSSEVANVASTASAAETPIPIGGLGELTSESIDKKSLNEIAFSSDPIAEEPIELRIATDEVRVVTDIDPNASVPPDEGEPIGYLPPDAPGDAAAFGRASEALAAAITRREWNMEQFLAIQKDALLLNYDQHARLTVQFQSALTAGTLDARAIAAAGVPYL